MSWGLARAASRLVTPSAAIPDSGVPLRQRALQITEDALGLDHPSTALRLSNLAVTYLDLGQADKALPLEERAPAHPCDFSGSTRGRLGIRAANGACDEQPPGAIEPTGSPRTPWVILLPGARA